MPSTEVTARLRHIIRCMRPPANSFAGALFCVPSAGDTMAAARFEREQWDGASTRPAAAAALAAAYTEHGIVVAQNLFSATECHAMEEELLRFQRGGYGGQVSAIEPQEEGSMERDELLGRYMYIFQPHAASSLIREWIVDRRLRDVLGSIVGSHLPGWDGAYKCMQTMFVTRKAGAPGSPWHQDEHPIPTRDRSLCGIWIALSDATVENGALWIVQQ